MNPRRGMVRRGQRGMTLVELMVAVVLGLLIAAAAVAALIIARQGFTSVDSGAQLRENSRFAANLIQRIVVQAGYEPNDTGYFSGDLKPPGLRGFDNAVVTFGGSAPTTTPTTTAPAHASDSRSSSTCGSTDTSCVNGSDVLVVRYHGVSRGGSADGSMINCAGVSEPERADHDQAYSIFHVVRSSSGEPTLACTYRNPADDKWTTTTLVTGVEGFQVLYGVDNNDDTVADQYRRGEELTTDAAWRSVRTIRVGLLVRGPAGSAVDAAATAASQAVLGSGFSDADDTGSELATSADGRLRQRYVFTVHLRNPQDKAL